MGTPGQVLDGNVLRERAHSPVRERALTSLLPVWETEAGYVTHWLGMDRKLPSRD